MNQPKRVPAIHVADRPSWLFEPYSDWPGFSVSGGPATDLMPKVQQGVREMVCWGDEIPEVFVGRGAASVTLYGAHIERVAICRTVRRGDDDDPQRRAIDNAMRLAAANLATALTCLAGVAEDAARDARSYSNDEYKRLRAKGWD